MAFVSRHAFPGVRSGNAARSNLPVEIEMTPLPAILAGQFEGLAARIRSAKKPLTESVNEVCIPAIIENFAQEGRPPWQGLTAETEAIREAAGFAGPHPILIRTAKLFRAATAKARWTIVKDQAYVSNWPNSVWYGPVHQNGAEVNVSTSVGNIAVGIPPRPFMLLQPSDVTDIEKVFDKWVVESAAESGFTAI